MRSGLRPRRVRSAAAGRLLDGEVANPADAASLPSGDGQPGGDAVVTFTVAPHGDFDHDGDVDLQDFNFFQMCFNGPNRSLDQGACESADADADADVDLDDFAAFQSCFSGPNRPAACTG